MSKNIAVILAGGKGVRFGEEIPKQFMLLNGKPIVEYAIAAFSQSTAIDEVCVVCSSDNIPLIRMLVDRGGYDKVGAILEGGRERYESSLAAIEHYQNDDDHLIFHDAVRPLVSQRIISDCIEALGHHDAVDVAIPAVDTIIKSNSRNEIDMVPDRSCLRMGQTPQCFKRKIISDAYKKALLDESFSTTDDCSVVLRYLPEIPIFIVHGETRNMKLTYKEDLNILESLIS